MKVKNRLKKILGIFLCMGMMMGLMPGGVLQLYAAGVTGHTHCLCGATHKAIGDHTTDTRTTFTAWTSTDSLPDAAGSYYLVEDVTLSERWKPQAGTVLCLNGKTITCAAADQPIVYVGDDLVITDCGTTGKMTHAAGIGGNGIANYGSFTMYGGAVSGNNSRCAGAGVENRDHFTMYGGAITNNNSGNFNGGGVFNASPCGDSGQCVFNLYGGTITGNTGWDGGGVFCNGIMTVSGKITITGNKSKSNDVSNVTLKTDSFSPTAVTTLTIKDDISGSIGVNTGTVEPEDADLTLIATGAKTNKDYSSIITSDNSKYKVIHDSSDGTKLVLTSGNTTEPTPAQHEHCICGTSHKTIGDHTTDTQTTFTAWTEPHSLPKTAGNYYLENDVWLSAANCYNGTKFCGWEVPDGTVLCLNGHSITINNPQDVDGDIDVIKVAGRFTLTDCKAQNEQGKITHGTTVTKHSGKGVKVLGGTFDMFGGTITGNTSAYDVGGSGVSIEGVSDTNTASVFRMYGGKISENTASSGGGVHVRRLAWYGPAEFDMYGGSIQGNVADSETQSYGVGGGVYVSWTSKFVMGGGTISQNRASQNGGGVYASAYAKEYASGNSGTATIEAFGDAAITGNTVAGKNNNVCLDSDVSSYEAFSTKINITSPLRGCIGVTTVNLPADGKPVTVATGATDGTDYSDKIVSDDTQYKLRKDGDALVLVTEKDASHQHIWGEWLHNDTHHWRVCSECSRESTPENHKWDGGVITQQPTTAAEGIKTFTCTVCGATRTEAVDKLTQTGYEILDGADGQHTIGQDEELIFRSSAALKDFIAVLVDGVEVDASNYELAEGSTIVRLKQSFLDTLSKGTHTISIQSVGGVAMAQFTIVEDSDSGTGKEENGGGSSSGSGSGSGNRGPNKTDQESGTGSGSTSVNNNVAGSGTGNSGVTGLVAKSSTPTAGITNIQPVSEQKVKQTAKATTDSKADTQAAGKTAATEETSPVALFVIVVIVVGGFALFIMERRKAGNVHKKS